MKSFVGINLTVDTLAVRVKKLKIRHATSASITKLRRSSVHLKEVEVGATSSAEERRNENSVITIYEYLNKGMTSVKKYDHIPTSIKCK